MIFTKVWFFIAAIILINISPAFAVSYIRVNQKGVIYYYFNNRGGTNPDCTPVTPPGGNSPRLQKVVPSQGPSPRLNLPLASVLLPNQVSADTNFNEDQVLSRTGQLTDNPGDVAADASQLNSQENSGEAKRGFLRLLTKLNFFDPPGLASGEEQDYFLHDTTFLVPDIWAKVPKYFQATTQKQNASAVADVSLPLSNPPPLPKYAYQPRLWGRVSSGGSFKPSSSQYYCFPVARSFTFRDTWGDPRPNGRIHRAVDIFAPEGTELYAITSGVIHSLATSSTGGIMLMLQGNDGRGYGYMHLMAYADGIVVGKSVKAGELIGYVGHTGTQSSPPHLHIQVYPDHQFSHETLVDPYEFFVQLCRGIGVSDVNQPRIARHQNANQLKIAQQFDPMAKNKNSKIKWIQVYQRPWPKGLGQHTLKLDLKSSSLLSIRNN
jgi:murein DD-endopeptidase MepM/ murein hydrolase activator NlpD